MEHKQLDGEKGGTHEMVEWCTRRQQQTKGTPSPPPPLPSAASSFRTIHLRFPTLTIAGVRVCDESARVASDCCCALLDHLAQLLARLGVAAL